MGLKCRHVRSYGREVEGESTYRGGEAMKVEAGTGVAQIRARQSPQLSGLGERSSLPLEPPGKQVTSHCLGGTAGTRGLQNPDRTRFFCSLTLSLCLFVAAASGSGSLPTLGSACLLQSTQACSGPLCTYWTHRPSESRARPVVGFGSTDI